MRSFEHAGLKRFFETGSKAGVQPAHAKKLAVQLFTLHAVKQPMDMDLPGWNSA
jgi:proteic killer suppression protein